MGTAVARRSRGKKSLVPRSSRSPKKYTSSVMDAQRKVTWQAIRWAEWLEAGTDVRFQVAVSDSPEGPFHFVGPNATAGSKFSTAAGEALTNKLYGQYFRYKAFLTGDGTVSPAFGDVQVSFSGLQPFSVRTYSYDPPGNRTKLVRETDEGVILTEVLDDEGWDPEDRINNLNQLMRRDIKDGEGTTTWRYTWDEDNRLVRVELNNVSQITFAYDILGRMLQRTSFDGGNPEENSRLEWDGWDVIAEQESDGTLTHYWCPEGKLHSFKRGASIYYVHADVLGSVRAVTDFAGQVVCRFETDPWGNLLPSSVNAVPGFAFHFIGAQGIRWEPKCNLYCIRQRWYDPQLSRFISRDAKSTEKNTYRYAFNSPLDFTDISGLDVAGAAKELAAANARPGATTAARSLGPQLVGGVVEGFLAASALKGFGDQYRQLAGLQNELNTLLRESTLASEQVQTGIKEMADELQQVETGLQDLRTALGVRKPRDYMLWRRGKWDTRQSLKSQARQCETQGFLVLWVIRVHLHAVSVTAMPQNPANLTQPS